MEQNPLSGAHNPFVSIPGKYKAQNTSLKLDESILSKHMMLIGGTGCGKSNVFYHIISQIKNKMSSKDVMIVFDTKGDYYNLFGKKDDLLIGNSSIYSSQSCKWNIFKEIVSDGWDDEKIEVNSQEISWSIFREAIEKSKDPIGHLKEAVVSINGEYGFNIEPEYLFVSSINFKNSFSFIIAFIKW